MMLREFFWRTVPDESCMDTVAVSHAALGLNLNFKLPSLDLPACIAQKTKEALNAYANSTDTDTTLL